MNSEILGNMFGVQDTPEQSRNVRLALLLRHLADLLEADEKPQQEVDGRATEPDEIRVRPRIEPLGGS